MARRTKAGAFVLRMAAGRSVISKVVIPLALEEGDASFTVVADDARPRDVVTGR